MRSGPCSKQLNQRNVQMHITQAGDRCALVPNAQRAMTTSLQRTPSRSGRGPSAHTPNRCLDRDRSALEAESLAVQQGISDRLASRFQQTSDGPTRNAHALTRFLLRQTLEVREPQSLQFIQPQNDLFQLG
jgi:hypothetical protein